MKPNELHAPTMDAKAAASYLGMSQAWIRKQVSGKTLPYLKIGRSVRFKLEDLSAYVEAHRVTGVRSNG